MSRAACSPTTRSSPTRSATPPTTPGTASGRCRCGRTTRSSCAPISPTWRTSAAVPRAALGAPRYRRDRLEERAREGLDRPAGSAPRAIPAAARRRKVTSIDFYFNAEDRLQVACRLAGKALARGQRVLIYAPEHDTAQRIDKMLWTWPAIGFVPHCAVHDALAAETPVLIASGDEAPPGCDLLLNLAAECPPHFARFERLLEIVAVDD